jgi:hypothetical protein
LSQVSIDHRVAQIELDFLLDGVSQFRYLDRRVSRFQIIINVISSSVVHFLILSSLLINLFRAKQLFIKKLQLPINVRPSQIESFGKLLDRNFFIQV